MAVATPLLDHIRREKRRKTILLDQVNKWLIQHGDMLDTFSEEDFAILRQLIVIGTKRDRNVFSPSGATNCSRQQVLDKLHFVSLDYKNPKTRIILNDGNWRHLRWQMIFWKMGIVRSLEEFTKEGDLEYGGSTDVIAIIEYKGRKIIIVIDIKGAHASQFNSIRDSGKPLPKHDIQLQIYLHLHPDADFALLWYENKNTNDLCEIVVKRKPKVMERALKRQRYMQKYVKAKALPKEECNFGDARDRRYNNCPQRANCGRLPVHLIREGEILKIGEPRKKSSDPLYASFNQLPLTLLEGPLGERVRPLKSSKT